MNFGSFKLHEKALIPLLCCALISLLLFCLNAHLLTTVFLLACIFIAYNFRDPERIVPSDISSFVLGWIDGRVMNIKKEIKIREKIADNKIEGNFNCISVDNGFLDVHVLFAPSELSLVGMSKIKQTPLISPYSWGERTEEKLAVVFESNKETFVLLVSGSRLLPSLSVSLSEGNKVDACSKIGLFGLGCKCDLYVPVNYIPSVLPGQTIVAGETIVANRIGSKKLTSESSNKKTSVTTKKKTARGSQESIRKSKSKNS